MALSPQLTQRQTVQAWFDVTNLILQNMGEGSSVQASPSTLILSDQLGKIDNSRLADTIDGNRTFSGTLSVPTPSSNQHAQTKLYVDGVLSTVESKSVIQGDGLVGGGTLQGASVTLDVDQTVVRTSGNQTITGNLSLIGNLTVSGDLTVVDTTNLSISDNEIELNAGEVGPGITHPSGAAGISIDRGSSPQQRFLFDEQDDKFKVDLGTGVLSPIVREQDLQQIATSGDFDDLQNVPNILIGNGTLYVINDIQDFPAPVQGVITLEQNVQYLVTNHIDLLGSRIVVGQNTTLFGTSSETASIRSTGLVGEALITSTDTLPMRNISFYGDGTQDHSIFDLDGSGNPNSAIDWMQVNVVNAPNIGTISGYQNFVLGFSQFLSSQGLVFDGNVQTIAATNSLFAGVEGLTIISFQPTCVVNRRSRVMFSSIFVPTGGLGIAVNSLLTFPNQESQMLDTVAFSGPGQYTTTQLESSNKAIFFNCTGIRNTPALASIYMANNQVQTTIDTIDTYVKFAGTTAQTIFEKFEMSQNNEITYIGQNPAYVKFTAAVSVQQQSNNQVVSLRFYKDSGQGFEPVIGSASRQRTITQGQGVSATCQQLILISPGDKLSLYVQNFSGTADITVIDVNIIAERY